MSTYADLDEVWFRRMVECDELLHAASIADDITVSDPEDQAAIRKFAAFCRERAREKRQRAAFAQFAAEEYDRQEAKAVDNLIVLVGRKTP